MPPAIDKDAKIPCPTSQHLQIELDALMAVLELREQEDTWEKMERAIIRFTGITRGGGYKHLPLFIDGMGKMGVGLKLGQCMLSDRGRLSGVATELLQTLAPRLGPAFNPLVPVYLAPLVQLLGRPNKVFLKRAEKCLWTIISNCHLPSILTELKRGLSDEAATCRRGCAAGFERALIDWDRAQFGERGAGVMEDALRKVGGDKDPEVRNTGKRIWAKFSEIWPERVDEFSGPLTPTIRRYLGVSAAASAHAGPSKPKAAPVRHAPPKPAALSASTSSLSMAAPPPPPPPAPTPPAPPAPIAQMLLPPPPPPQTAALPLPVRPQVLGGRAVRPPLLTTQSEALPSLPPLSAASESIRPRRSPVKFPLPGGPAVPSSSASYTDLADLHQLPPRQRILSARAPRYPPGVLGLGQHGRSISQSVLPTPIPDMPSPTFANIPSETGPADHIPSDPHFARPAFPTSYSSTSLPTALPISDAWQPTRRFADGGVRSVRPGLLSSSSEMDLLGGPSRSHTVPATPSVLRGAIRSGPLAPSQPSRRDLGQAQRRIISAPIPSSLSNPTFFTETNPELGRSTSVRDRIVEMERKAAEAEMEAAKVPLPISPVAERFGGAVGSGSGSRSGTPSVSRVRVGRGEGTELDSPMMPVSMSILARSRNKGMDEEVQEKVEGDVSGGTEDMLMDEEIPNESVSDMTFSETRGKAQAPQAVEIAQLDEPEQGEDQSDQLPASPAAGIPEMVSSSVETLSNLPTPALVATPIIPPTTTEALPQPRPTSPILSSAAQQESLVTSEQSLAPPAAPQPKLRKHPLPPTSVGHSTAPTRRAAPIPTAAPSERLPPVAASRPVKPRIPVNEPRKPFRPTTKPALPPTSTMPPAASSFKAEVPAAPREQVSRVSKPPIPSRGAPPVSRAVSASRAPSTSSAATTAASATTVAPSVRPRVASTSSNLTKPTAASLHRATAQPAPKPRLPSSTSMAVSAPISASSLPPAVKKDKVKRKAAVPSFRPTRTGAEATARGTASLSASTISHRSTSASGASASASAGAGAGGNAGVDGGKGMKEIVAKVKVRVKPESVPLPLSPGEKRAVEIPLPASPAIGEFTGRVKVRAKPVVVDLASTGGGGEKPDSISADMVPLPPSPTSAIPHLLASGSTPPSPDAPAIAYPILSPIVHHTSSKSPARQISKLSDIGLPNLTSHTPISKASTAPAGSDWAGSDSEDDDSAEVTFGKNGNKGRLEAVDLMMDNGGERDLIEFSAASRAPLSSPDRQAGDEGVEKDFMEFSAPSRPLLSEGVENDLMRVEGGVVKDKGGMGKGDLGMMSGSCGASPRVALSVVDRNGARDEDLMI